jgi:hypothetical protein
MSVPINRGPDGLSRSVYALIFNGITRASSSATDEADWIRLSERERIAEAVYAELAAGNIQFRLGGLALLAQVAGDPPACCDLHNRHCEPPGDLCCGSCTEINHPQHPAGVQCTWTTGSNSSGGA